MSEIFVSYKREDLAVVQLLVQGLRGAGLSVWWDQDIAPDAQWEATIERELKAAQAVVVTWSPPAVESENVRSEARFARTQGKLIQVFVRPCAPPLFFGERQGVDLTAWNGAANDHRFKTIVEAVRAIIDGKKPPHGVGYAPKKRNYWRAIFTAGAVLSGALALLANAGGARDTVCSATPSVTEWCAARGWITQPALDPTAILAAERERLLSQLNGRWARGDVDPITRQPRDCTRDVVTIAIVADAASITRVHLTAEGFESHDQVESAGDGIVRVSGRDSTGVLVEGRYEPAGDRLTYTSGGTATLLHRCP